VNIGIIGAPGAGKREFAIELGIKLKQEYGSTKIIDNYVEELSKTVDTTFGLFASWLGNLQIAMERYNRERKYAGYDNVITCGTLIETMVYTAFYGTLGGNSVDEEVRRYTLARTGPTVELLGGMIGDTWEYDHAFYLPLEDGDTYDHKIDSAIPQAFEAFGLSYTTLTDDKVQNALSHIERKRENEAVNAESVSGSGEGSEAIGDSPGSVPDLRQPSDA
jgi:hypothetical protein